MLDPPQKTYITDGLCKSLLIVLGGNNIRREDLY